jgi:hypothetical protein
VKEIFGMDFNSLVAQFGALAGFAALVAAIINILKSAGLVKPGQAQTYSAILNLVGLIVLLSLKIFQPQADVAYLDGQAAQIANVLIVVAGYVVQLGGAKLMHLLLTGTPVVGKSFE